VYAYLRWSDKNAYADPLLRMPRFHLALFKEADVKHAIKIRSKRVLVDPFFRWIDIADESLRNHSLDTPPVVALNTISIDFTLFIW
jgi:hypothetical protein